MNYTDKDLIKVLIDIDQSSSGIYRKFMTSDERKICNQLVKHDMICKGYPDEKNSTIAFYITDKGRDWLNFIKELDGHV